MALAAVEDRIEVFETRIENLEDEVGELKRVMSSEGELERWRMKQVWCNNSNNKKRNNR
jgi:hypothetical protein